MMSMLNFHECATKNPVARTSAHGRDGAGIREKDENLLKFPRRCESDGWLGDTAGRISTTLNEFGMQGLLEDVMIEPVKKERGG